MKIMTIAMRGKVRCSYRFSQVYERSGIFGRVIRGNARVFPLGVISPYLLILSIIRGKLEPDSELWGIWYHFGFVYCQGMLMMWFYCYGCSLTEFLWSWKILIPGNAGRVPPSINDVKELLVNWVKTGENIRQTKTRISGTWALRITSILHYAKAMKRTGAQGL